MKVLHIIPSVSPIHGGPSLAIIGMVKSLINQGLSVEVVTTNDNGKNLLDVPIRQNFFYKEVPFYFCNCLPYWQQYALSNDLAQWLWENIRNYDLLHIHSIFSYSSTVAMAIARYQKIPYLVRPLGQLCKWPLQQNSLVKKIYFDLIGYKNINNARAIHFTAYQEEQEAQVLNLQPKPVIIPLGVDSPPAIPNASIRLRNLLKISNDEPIILFLSRIHPKKGLDYLIPALGKLSSSYLFHFIIAGDGKEEDKQHLNQLLEEYRLTDKTHLLGFVEGEQKNLLLQGSDMFALTSHSENFGVVVLEAMVAGLPVLLTPGVALASMVKENQLGYVPYLDSDSIALNLEKLLQNPEQTKEMGERGKTFVKNHYTWDQIAKQLITTYENILN